MPYQPHTLITVGGTMAEKSADDEIWQFGIRGFADGGGQIPADKLADLALYVLRGPTGSGGGMESIWATSNSHIPAEAKLVWCKAANINPDGTYADEPGIAQMTPKPGIVTQVLPAFCSLAISLTTGLTLGRAVRGRVYPPNCGAVINVGSAVSATVAGDILTWGGTMLDVFDTSLASDPEVVWHPYIVSSFGVSHPVTGLRVGNVVDTQRRRRDKVAETYVDASWSA